MKNMTTIDNLETELKIIKEQTRVNTIKFNTIIFMLNKICKELKVELRR